LEVSIHRLSSQSKSDFFVVKISFSFTFIEMIQIINWNYLTVLKILGIQGEIEVKYFLCELENNQIFLRHK